MVPSYAHEVQVSMLVLEDPSDRATLSSLLDRIEQLVQALKLCDAAAKVRGTLGAVRDARSSGDDLQGALARMQEQVDAMLEKETVYLLSAAVTDARRAAGASEEGTGGSIGAGLR